MPRDYKLYLDDIVAAIATVRTYTTGYDYDQFVADRKTVDIDFTHGQVTSHL